MVVPVRCCLAAGGHVIAVGPNVLWHLGTTFSEALAYIVDGDGGGGRGERADRLANCPTPG